MVFDKVLCPWCGTEMEIKAHPHIADYTAIYARGAKKRLYRWTAWASCTNGDCGADGPIALELESEQEAREAARAAALRRYTPTIKPMERQELPRHYFMPCWIERIGEKAYPDLLDRDSTGFYGKFENLNARETDYLLYANYGRTWRCWARRPTDEERSAAEWET